MDTEEIRSAMSIVAQVANRMDDSAFTADLSRAESNTKHAVQDLTRALGKLYGQMLLAEQEQAERNLPIDEEWLRSIGAQKHAINRWSFPHFNLWICGARKEWCVKLNGNMTVFVTRGQLLKLIDLFNSLEGGAT